MPIGDLAVNTQQRCKEPPMSNTLSALSADIANIAASAAPGIVRVHARKGPPASGIVWKPGFVVTAEEAIEADDDIAITLPDGTRAAATLAGRDASTDVALLRCDAAVTALASPVVAGAAALGHLAVALGAGRHGTRAGLAMVSSVSGSWQSMQGGKIDQYIGLNLGFDRHLEGGALLSAEGALIGMIAVGPRHTHLAIPTATIERVAAVLEAKGRVARGYLGAGLQSVHVEPLAGSTDKRKGVMVVGVDASGPAAAAGLKQGDIVLAWNGEAVASVRDVIHRLTPDTVGTAVDLALSRAGQPAAARLTIGERPTT
jgi:S1-C subfamily serine protease